MSVEQDVSPILPGSDLREKVLNIDLAGVYAGDPLPDLTWGVDLSREESFELLNRLIEFCTQKSQELAASNSQEGRKNFNNFLERIHQSFFGFSPNIFNACTLSDDLELGAKITRVPEARGWIGGAMVGELVYTLSFAGDEYIQSNLQQLDGKTVGEIVDIIDFLQVVGADSLAQGYSQDRGFKHVLEILDYLDERNPSPFVHYAVNLNRSRLNSEVNDPSLSFLKYTGDRKEGRLNKVISEQLEQENEILQRTFRPDVEVNADDKVIRIAKDAVAVIDHSNMPRYYAFINPETVMIERGVSQARINRFQEFLANPQRVAEFSAHELVEYFNQHFITVGKDIDSENFSLQGEEWRNLAGFLSSEEWQEFFKTVAKFKEIQTRFVNFQQDLKQKYEEMNLELTNALLKESYEIINQNPDLASMPGYSEFLQSYKSQDEDMAYEQFSGSTIAQTADYFLRERDTQTYLPKIDPRLAEFREKLEKLRDDHQRNWQKLKKEVQLAASNIEIEHKEIIDLLNHYYQKIEDHRPEIINILNIETGKIKEQSASTSLNFTLYDQLHEDPKINPFGQEEDDLSVLLKQLHQPDMRALIEHDLDISLNEMSLASQIQLLRYLAADGKSKQFGRVRQVLALKPEYSQNFLNSFLSCAEDVGMGDKILKIAENSPKVASDIFGKYAKIVNAVENVRSYLMENYHGQTDNQTIQLITQNLLRKGKDLLSDFADNPREPEEVIRALDDYKTETLIFASTCRALKKERQEINLEDFSKYGVDVLQATEISSEDQQVMAQILSKNWQNQDPDIGEFALHGLQESFRNPESRFYILRYEGKILGFKRFDNLEKNDLYAGSFNINPILQRSGIGEAAMKTYLAQEAKEHVIHADTSPFLPVCTRYIGEFGFVGTGVEEREYKGKRFWGLGMERNDQVSGSYRYLNSSYGEIAKNYRNGETDPETGIRIILVDRKELISVLEANLKNNIVLTAYKSNPDNQDQYLLVFEQKATVPLAV